MFGATHANGEVGYNDASVRDDDDVFDAFLGHVATLERAVADLFDLHVDGLVINVRDLHAKWSDSS